MGKRKRKPRGPRSRQTSIVHRLAREQSLRPWHEVAEAWNRMSGESIGTNRVQQIAQMANEKILRALANAGITESELPRCRK